MWTALMYVIKERLKKHSIGKAKQAHTAAIQPYWAADKYGNINLFILHCT